MDERWGQVRQIFPKVLWASPEERPALLSQLCGEDDDLRSEIESLVEAHDRAAEFLEEPSPSLEPPRIQRYRTVRALGTGGMGVVYLATRDDDAFKKRVAIKVLRPDIAGSELIARFQRERQILAALEHPNIARLFDGGATEDGRPYLVMEFIDGRPLDLYCHELRLSVEQRLEIFLQICEAVEFAHRNLVVHRDLKAGNILVTEDGVPKLLDFGIAKLLNPELASPSMAPTVTALRVMTPEAASPEQIQGGAMTTATDIYSLGVLLYGLLTGYPPYNLEGCSVAESLRKICHEEPEDPSRKVLAQDEPSAEEDAPRLPLANRKRLARRLRGDLDRIVKKALRKEPRWRYGSVHALAEDVRAHLLGLPIQARSSGWGYRWAKGLVRNRAWVAAAALLLILGGVFSFQMLHQRDLARDARDEALELQGLLVDIFEISDPQSEGEISAREVLDRGSQRVLKDLGSRPRLQADLLRTLGVIHSRLALHAPAVALLEQSAVRGPKKDADPVWRAATLDELGMALFEGLSGASRAKTLERIDDLYREALELRLAHFGPRHATVAVSWKLLGNVAWELGDLEAASRRYLRALEMWEALGFPDEGERATVLNNLANVRFAERDLETSENLHQEALRLRRLVLGEEHLDVAESANNLATVLLRRGEAVEARKLLVIAVEIRRARYGRLHPRVLESEGNLAATLHELGDLDAAEAEYRQLLDAYNSRPGPLPAAALGARNNLASLERDRGNYRAAAELYEELVVELERQGFESRIASALIGWGNALERSGEAAAAQAAALRAVEQMNRDGAEPWRIGTGHAVLGGALLALGEGGKAREHLETATTLLAGSDQPAAVRYLGQVQEHLDALQATEVEGGQVHRILDERSH